MRTHHNRRGLHVLRLGHELGRRRRRRRLLGGDLRDFARDVRRRQSRGIRVRIRANLARFVRDARARGDRDSRRG